MRGEREGRKEGRRKGVGERKTGRGKLGTLISRLSKPMPTGPLLWQNLCPSGNSPHSPYFLVPIKTTYLGRHRLTSLENEFMVTGGGRVGSER